MGLDVSVYANVKEIHLDDNIDPEVGKDYDFQAYVINPDWEHKIKNLTVGGYYKGDLIEDVDISYSYSTHGRFRVELIRLIGRSLDLLKVDGTIDWDKISLNLHLPFMGLINFADNEGCLDWETSAILYDDFSRYKAADQEYLIDAHHVQYYQRWLSIFEQAKKPNNVVVFR